MPGFFFGIFFLVAPVVLALDGRWQLDRPLMPLLVQALKQRRAGAVSSQRDAGTNSAPQLGLSAVLLFFSTVVSSYDMLDALRGRRLANVQHSCVSESLSPQTVSLFHITDSDAQD